MRKFINTKLMALLAVTTISTQQAYAEYPLKVQKGIVCAALFGFQSTIEKNREPSKRNNELYRTLLNYSGDMLMIGRKHGFSQNELLKEYDKTIKAYFETFTKDNSSQAFQKLLNGCLVFGEQEGIIK